jgi:glutathione S-transferase
MRRRTGLPRLAAVSDPHETCQPANPPNHVWVYGNDHSPWVQAVLLGLHQNEIAHTLVTVPPLSIFLKSGILMPAARIDERPWLLDSEAILVRLAFSEVEPGTRRALMDVFISGAMRRADDAWKFWRRFSYVRDGHPSFPRRLWNQFWRSFSIFYFFTLIRIGRRTRPRATPEQLAREFSFFQERLVPGSEFIGGAAPDTVDLQLFGLVQMFESIPGPSLVVLREDPTLERLREWVEAMQRRFADYTHLYSARDFEPKRPEIEPATAVERFFYWSGATLMWIAFPITLPTVFYFARIAAKKRVRLS